jgi:hypothetical protein
MSSQPIAGVAVWAHTGRGLLLDDSTARRVMHEWRRVLRDRPLIAGVGPRSKELNAAHALSSTLADGLGSSRMWRRCFTGLPTILVKGSRAKGFADTRIPRASFQPLACLLSCFTSMKPRGHSLLRRVCLMISWHFQMSSESRWRRWIV